MARNPLSRRSASMVLVAGGDRLNLIRVAASTVLQHGEQRAAIERRDAELTLASRSEVVSGPTPRLIATTLLTGGSNYTCRDNFWSHIGRIRFRCTTGGVPVDGSETVYSATGTEDPAPLGGGGLSVGVVYQLQYQLDCVPNVPGYGEDWTDVTGITWTQPTKENEQEYNYDNP